MGFFDGLEEERRAKSFCTRWGVAAIVIVLSLPVIMLLVLFFAKG